MMASDELQSNLKEDAAPGAKTLFFLEGRRVDSRFSEYQIAQISKVRRFSDVLAIQARYTKHNASAPSLMVLTDLFEYQSTDQVIPLQPEQLFFMDYTDLAQIEGCHVLEVGLGSGVLSIFCLLNGAKYCSGLEINPRAKILTGFNAVVNGVEDRLSIIDGSTRDIFSTVRGQKFDFVFSNPPFEPTPPQMKYYANSAAGVFGLSFVEELLKGINAVLKDSGTFQMVTMAPGDENTPFMLHELIERYLPNSASDIVLDTQPILYGSFVDRFVKIFGIDSNEIDKMKEEAAHRRVTHLHMLVFKYRKGVQGKITTTCAKKNYESWQSPLGTTQI